MQIDVTRLVNVKVMLLLKVTVLHNNACRGYIWVLEEDNLKFTIHLAKSYHDNPIVSRAICRKETLQKLMHREKLLKLLK
jgi:hypothetical protein